jgi:hypothetical protein
MRNRDRDKYLENERSNILEVVSIEILNSRFG